MQTNDTPIDWKETAFRILLTLLFVVIIQRIIEAVLGWSSCLSWCTP